MQSYVAHAKYDAAARLYYFDNVIIRVVIRACGSLAGIIFGSVMSVCPSFKWSKLLKVKTSQSVSGTLDRPRVVAPSKTCGHVRSCRRRWRSAQCRPRSAAPTFGRVVLAGASTPAWCPVYRLCERPQPGTVWGPEFSPVSRDDPYRAGCLYY